MLICFKYFLKVCFSCKYFSIVISLYFIDLKIFILIHYLHWQRILYLILQVNYIRTQILLSDKIILSLHKRKRSSYSDDQIHLFPIQELSQ